MADLPEKLDIRLPEGIFGGGGGKRCWEKKESKTSMNPL